MNGILNRHHIMGILLLCVMTLVSLANFGGASGTLTASDGATYDIAVTYGASARIPAGSSLEVSELSGVRYRGYYDRAVAEVGRFDSMRAFDIRCLAPDGTEIEPSAPVKVTFRLPGNGEAARTRILHFMDGGGVVAPSLKRGGGAALDFETDSFSVYAVVATEPVLDYQSVGEPLEIMDGGIVSEKFLDFTADIFPAYLLAGTEYEAKVGDTYCTTLAAALAAAQNGDTIVLLKDVTGSFQFNKNRTISLDLGGHTFTVDTPMGIQAQAGNLTIINGVIESSETLPIFLSSGKITLGNDLTVHTSSSGNSAIYVTAGALVIDGATVGGAEGKPLISAYGNTSSVEVKSGSLSGNPVTVYVWNYAKGTISGGTFNGVSVKQGGRVNITGGMFNAPVSTEDDTSTLIISGGVFQQDLESLLPYIVPETPYFVDANGYVHVGDGGLLITADSDSKVYDGTPLTVTTWTSSGLLAEGDYIESVTVTGSQTNAGSSHNVPSGAVIKNAAGNDVTGDYAITYVSGTLEVTRKPVTVKADDKTKVYGAEDPEFTATVTGTVGEDTVAYTISRETGADVGTYTITPAGDAEQGNYTVTYETGTLTINGSDDLIPVTVAVNDVSKTYGGENPELTATVTGLPEGVSQDTIVYTISRETGENVGTYVITPTGEAVQGNYAVTYEPGTFTITPAAVTVTADDKTKVYGEADPELTATVTGLVGTDTIEYGLSRAEGEDVGEYIITVSGNAEQNNYTVTYATGTFTITPAEVTVTVDDDQTKVYGETDPVLTATVTGLVGEDTISYELSRQTGEDVGTYDITPTGEAEQGNYHVVFTPGVFTITPRPVTVTVTGENDTAPYDGTEHSIDGYNVDEISDTLYKENDFHHVDGTTEAKRTNVGTTEMGLQFVNDNPNFDVTFNITDGYQEITPLDVTVTIVGNFAEFAYDGNEHSASGYTASVDSDLYDVDEDFTFSGTAEAKRTDAGITYMELKPEQFENTNGNFTATFVVVPDGYVSITPIEATVVIIGHNHTAAYDGMEHSVSGYDVQQMGEISLYKEEYVTLNGTAEATRTDAGTTYMGLSEANFSNNSDNFINVNFVVTDGYQTITPIDATVTITGHSDTVAYDGQEHSVSGYDVEFSTDLYTVDDFSFVGNDVAKRTEAGTTEMNLSPDFFSNASPNFETVTFEVTDGWITVNPSVVVSKTLEDELVTTPEPFTFHVNLTDDEEPINDYLLAEGITTDESGNATFTIAVSGGETKSQRLSVPLGSSLTVVEATEDNINNYITWISVDGDEYEDVTASLYSVAESQTNIIFTNVRGAICRIEGNEFQTISSAVEFARTEYGGTAVIEMLTDYTMSAADAVVIPANCNITLSTAPEYDGEAEDGIATITRAPGHTGFMFTNNGTLNLGGEELDSKIVLDGNGNAVEAAQAMILNGGTVNIRDGATIQNTNNTASNGGAIRSTGTVNISGGTLRGNHATMNGGAVYATDGTVNISGGTMISNTADNGGAVYAHGATVYVTDGTLIGNAAAVHGGAIYTTSGVNVSGGLIGGTESEAANTARNGAAIFVASGVASFSGGNIAGNVATEGGAVGIGTVSVTLNFSDSPKIIGNTMSQTIDEETTVSPANVCLSEDSAHIINALGLNEAEAQIGIYVPGNGTLYTNRGVSKAQFGSYTSMDGINAFSNDRTPGMKVSGENSWLVWGKSLKVETRYLANFNPASLPPVTKGTVKAVLDYYPANIDNYVSDIAVDSKLAVTNPVDAAFACAFVTGDTTYGQCLSKVNWDNTTGNWGAVRRNGTTVDNVETLILYYSLPAYISIANNTDYPLDISSLTFNGIDAASNGYGFLVARNGATVDHFVPLEATDLQLAKEKNIKLMFPGVRQQQYELNGAFRNFEPGASVDYTYDTTSDGTTRNTQSATLIYTQMDSFTVTGTTFDSSSTIEVVFGEATTICKIVELNPDGTVKEEHFYSSLQNAVEDGGANYNAYKVSVTDGDSSYDTVKIEMLQDYLIPSTDTPDIPSGMNFTFTTARQGETLGVRHYTGNGDRAVISQDQGNINSFITAKTGGAGTSLTIENLDFEGKQLSNVTGNGGVVNTKDCDVTVRNANFSNFTAQNGGAIYADFNTKDTTLNHVLRVSNAVFTGCISLAKEDRFGGGAIWTNAEVFALSNGTFEACTATQQGGAVFHRIDSNYGYRATSQTVVSNCTFAHCNGAAAGALEINGYHITVANCSFDDCQARSRNGGAFNAFLQETGSETTLAVEGCTFTNCFANQNGGSFRTMYKTTTVKDCTFTNSTANKDGGGIAQTNGSEIVLDHCTITGNKSGTKGGGVCAVGNVTLRNDTTITGNSLTTTVVENGAGVYIPNGKILTVGPKDESNSSVADTIIVRDNTTVDGKASNLRLAGSATENTVGCVIICSHLTPASELRVLNANKAGTKFGLARGVEFPEGVIAFKGDYNDLYGALDRTDSTGKTVIWRGQPICKITDGNGQLLYFDPNHTDPAVFDHLDIGAGTANKSTAFGLLRNTKDDLKLYYHDGTEYNANERTYRVEMLIEKYTVSKYISTNYNNQSWQTIVLTTAKKTNTQYPYDVYTYRGGEGIPATIIRGSSVGDNNLFLVYVNTKLEDITLDGGSANGIPASGNSRLIQMNPNKGTNAMLTVGKNATLQNARTTGNGAGVLLNWGSSLKMDGGRITNCVANGNGGGVYKDGGNGKFFLIDGSIDHCTAKDGGGVYIVKHNDNVKSEMSGGSITNCTATHSGGAVYVNNSTGFYMSGGAIRNNSAPTGGGIAVGGSASKLYFSGDVVVYNNTKGNGAKCNVELNQNTDAVINTSGLGDNALIGVYVPGDDNTDPYKTRGGEGDVFGSRTGNSNLFLFVNDRNDLRGWEKDTNKVLWVKMQSLSVSKTVSSDLTSDRNVSFYFTVTLDSSISGTLGSGRTSMTFTNGVSTFSLKHGESKTALYIPTLVGAGNLTGSYTVEETENTGFTTTPGLTVTDTFDKKDDDGNPVSAHTVAFTNTRKTGNLTVGKTVDSDDPEDLGKEFSFTVLLVCNDNLSGTYGDMTFTNNKATFILHDGETKTAENLPTGIRYTVTEGYNNNFNTTIKVNGEETASAANVELQPGDENHVQFTNKRKKGGLIVKKTVSSDAAADKELPFQFTVTLSDKSTRTYGEGDNAMHFVDGVATFSLKDGEYREAIGLPYGVTYTVTEENVPGFINTRKTNSMGRITDNVITSTFINTRQTGKLTIHKAVISDRYADRDTSFTFRVSLGKDDGGVFTIDDTITKTYRGAEFTNGVAMVTIKGASTKTITGLPQNVAYQVEEVDIPANFTNTDKAYDTGTISTEGITTTFTNTRAKGDLNISKSVVNGLSEDADTEFTFNVKLGDTKINKAFNVKRNPGEIDETVTLKNGAAKVTLKDGQSITIFGLPTDVTYTVTETQNNNFTPSVTGGTGTISTDLSEAAFTNTRKQGVLKVSKTVDNYIEAIDKEQEFAFTVTLTDTTIGNTAETPDGKAYGDMTFKDGVATFTLKHGQELEARDLPIGVGYTVTETPNDDFTTAKTGASSIISTSASAAKFTNTRRPGTLTITKAVDSPVLEDRNKNYAFTIQLGTLDGDGNFVAASIGHTYMASGVRFNSNGVSDTVQIAGGTSKSISLPCGLAYKVSEAPVTRMTTTIKDATGADVSDSGYAVGAISRNTDSKVTFTNKRDTGSLKVSKTVVSSLDADKDKPFHFTVTLTGDPVENGTYGGMTFTNNEATFDLKDGQSATATGLPVGIHYTVKEDDYSDFTTTSTGETDTIGTNSEAAFTNTQNGISVGFKKVDGSGNPVSGAVFELYTDSRCRPEYSEGIVTTSDFEGNISFDTLSYGLHYMKETVTPEEYVESDKTYIVIVGGEEVWESARVSGLLGEGVAQKPGENVAIFLFSGGQAQATPDISKFGIMNLPKKTSRVILRKIGEAKDGSGNYVPLPSVEFEILYWDKTIAASGTSQSNGVFWVGSLPHGTYYLHETTETIPNGYGKISEEEGNWFTFEVKDNVATVLHPLTEKP